MGVAGYGSMERNPLGILQIITEIVKYFAFRACAETQTKALQENIKFSSSQKRRGSHAPYASSDCAAIPLLPLLFWDRVTGEKKLLKV